VRRGVGVGEDFAEVALVSRDGDFEVGRFGEPEALLFPLGVDGFGE